MCDYSLHEYNSRLANVGENLVAHRFSRGSVGLVAQWATVNAAHVCAICVPPGSKLTLSNISVKIQEECGVGAEEKVTFVQTSMDPYKHRDGVSFENGVTVSLQSFTDEHVNVISLGEVEEESADALMGQTRVDEPEPVLAGAGTGRGILGGARRRFRGLSTLIGG